MLYHTIYKHHVH